MPKKTEPDDRISLTSGLLLYRLGLPAHTGMTLAAIDKHITRRTFPPPDGRGGPRAANARSPFWRATTIDRWMQTRRSVGQHGHQPNRAATIAAKKKDTAHAG